MSRYIVQSLSTGRFLVPGELSEVDWQIRLSESGGGIVPDIEHAEQLLCDWCDLDDMAVVVDLDEAGF
jgi:hypothetical protein